MMRIYCRDHHGKRDLCSECQELFNYSTARLERCRFQPNKPTCAKCPVHCYKPQAREQVRQVMIYSGPRMIWKHPILAVRHLLDGKKTVG